MSTDNFPSKHAGLQQAFFQKFIQSDESNKDKKSRAQSDLNEQKRQSVNVLDLGLRQTAFTFLSKAGSSTDTTINALKITAQQMAIELRERTTKLYKDKLAEADACKNRIRLNDKEHNLVLRWGEVNTKRLNTSYSSVQDKGVSETLEAWAEQATKSRQKIIELGNPTQYGSGYVGRSILEVIQDIGRGIFLFISLIFLFFISGEIGYIVGVAVAAIFLGAAWGISEWTGFSYGPVLLTLIGLFFGAFVLIGGLGVFSDEKKEISRKEKNEKRDKLIAGYSAYQTFKRAEGLMQSLYEKKVRQLETQMNKEIEDVTKQEQEMMLSITRFKAELEQAERLNRASLQNIELDYQREQKELKQEFETIRKELALYSKLAIAEWNDPFWQLGVADALSERLSDIRKGVGEIRIGSAVYPVADQRKVRLPMLIDMTQCGHIFILATQETEQQATQLLKAIVARLVFAIPLNGGKFVFIDTEVAGVFAEYHLLPEKMGKNSYSFPKDIQDRTQELEQHQKRMQAKVGNGDLETYNSIAKEPEMQRIVCISGFPNPIRFRDEAQSHLENIIRNGAKVGIHVVLKINIDALESNSNSRFTPELYSRYGVVLQPLKHSEKWDVHYRGQMIPFVPDAPPDFMLIDPIIQQIHTRLASKPVDRPIKVFIIYAVEDRDLVRELYEKLKAENWIQPWLNREVLLPGQAWELEISNAVQKCDIVIACLSNNSVSKTGYVQKELRIALNVALEKPEGEIFIIPVRMEDCPAPSHLRSLHWVDYFPHERREEAFDQLLKALKACYEDRSSE